MKIRRALAVTAALTLPLVGLSLPAEADTAKVCVGTSGIGYDANGSAGGLHYTTQKKGACHDWNAKAAWRAASGDKSMALITGIYGVKCVNITSTRIGDPHGQRVNIDSYNKKDCKN